GVYYMTTQPADAEKDQTKLRHFTSLDEVLFAYDKHRIRIHDPIVFRLPKGRWSHVVDEQKGSPRHIKEGETRIVTTVGRLLLNDILEQNLPYYNCAL